MSRGKRFLLAGAGTVVVLLGLAFLGWYVPTRKAVDVGAAMLAKQVCSCIYLAGRSLEECRADQFETMDPIMVEALREVGRVRAWIPGFGERTALYREGLGCNLE